MTSITQTIDNYIGGISQQPDEKKLPGQLVTAKNVLPDVVEGLKKRPGSNLIASLSDGSANSETHGKWFHYYRDENEQYVGQISQTGTVRMWDCATGAEKTVTNNLSSNSYLSHTADADLQTLTLNDYTYITNRTKATEMKALDTTSPNVYDGESNKNPIRNPEAFVELKKVAYASQYALNLYDNTDGDPETVSTVTRLKIISEDLDNDSYCPNVGTEIFNKSGGLHSKHKVKDIVIGTTEGTDFIITDTACTYKFIYTPPAWAGSTAYNVGDYVSANSKIYKATTSGTSTGSTAPSVSTGTQTIGGNTWKYIHNDTHITLTVENATYSTLHDLITGWQEHTHYTKLPFSIIYVGTEEFDIIYKDPGAKPITTTELTRQYTSGGDIRTIEDTDGQYGELESTLTGTIDNSKQDLYFRLTTTGQAVPEGSGTDSSPAYQCRYTTTHDLLHGGSGWEVGDEIIITMKNGLYTVTVEEVSVSKVQANLGLIRTTPTSFDTKTTVTAESILGDLRAAIDADDGANFDNVKQIGNGLHITRPSILNGNGEETNDFNINTPSPDLLNVFTNEVQDIADLPNQCVDGYTVKIRNSEANEDDYYVRFISDNGRDGTGVWEECPKPGRKVAFDENTMPIKLVRNADGTFTLDEIDWQICLVGNTDTVPEPSFIKTSDGLPKSNSNTYVGTINKMLFWRNRMVLLSDENVIMSQPGEYFNYWPKSAITYTASDVIDISVSSEFPAIIYDGVQTNSGLLLFSKNQQYLVTTDSDVLSPQTAKINTISTYNFNFNTNPISLGTTTAFLDNAGKYSRLWEMANVLREGEPVVVDQTKVVSKLFDKDLNLIANSRENSIIFFTKKDSSTIYGYKYFNSSEKRLQQSWFTWELAGAIQHIAVLDDALFVVLRNNSKDTLQKIAIKIDDDTHISVDDKGTTDASDDVTYRVYLDNTYKFPDKAYKFTWNGSADYIDVYTTDNLGNVGTNVNLIFQPTLATLNATNGTTYEVKGNYSGYVRIEPIHPGSVFDNSSNADLLNNLPLDGDGKAFGYVQVNASDNSSSDITTFMYDSIDNKSLAKKPDGFNNSDKSIYAFSDTGDYIPLLGTTNFELTGDWMGSTNIFAGYNYDMEIQFPTIYYTQQTGDAIKVDTTGSLTVHRLKINFGGSGSYITTLDRTGKASSSYTESRESPLADSYTADKIAVNDLITQTIPVYEKNKNFNLIVKSTHPTPATLYSMSWEGAYTTNYYQRV